MEAYVYLLDWVCDKRCPQLLRNGEISSNGVVIPGTEERSSYEINIWTLIDNIRTSTFAFA